jgi:hypothetical protein
VETFLGVADEYDKVLPFALVGRWRLLMPFGCLGGS